MKSIEDVKVEAALTRIQQQRAKQDASLQRRKAIAQKQKLRRFSRMVKDRLAQHGIKAGRKEDEENFIAEVVYKAHGPDFDIDNVDPIETADIYAADASYYAADRREGAQR